MSVLVLNAECRSCHPCACALWGGAVLAVLKISTMARDHESLALSAHGTKGSWDLLPGRAEFAESVVAQLSTHITTAV
jgi:hypothetical protein